VGSTKINPTAAIVWELFGLKKHDIAVRTVQFDFQQLPVRNPLVVRFVHSPTGIAVLFED
jgi:hypothetical protein